MEMTGTQRIEATREEVYAALNDAEVLRQCIPGCETIEKLSDTAAGDRPKEIPLRVDDDIAFDAADASYCDVEGRAGESVLQRLNHPFRSRSAEWI